MLVELVAGWIVFMTIVTWLIYRLDKRRAQRGKRRISERTLLLLALCGGVIGALFGIYGHQYHHKSSKFSFMLPFYGIVALYIVGGILLWRKLHG